MAQEYNIKDLADLPKRQCQKLADKLKPIAHQCLGLISGNHEDSLRMHNTFDPTEYLAELLNTESLGGKGWVILRFLRTKGNGVDGVETYRICVAHGTGGGGMREEKAAALAQAKKHMLNLVQKYGTAEERAQAIKSMRGEEGAGGGWSMR